MDPRLFQYLVIEQSKYGILLLDNVSKDLQNILIMEIQ